MKLKHIQAFSLVELMIGIVLGLMLIAGLAEILISSSSSYRQQRELMAMQQDGQFTLETLLRDIRNTGFWGCLDSLSKVNNALNSSAVGYSQWYSYEDAVEGTANAASGGTQVAGSDSITIRSARNIGSGSPLISPFATTISSPLQIAAGNNLQAGDIVLVSDCLQGDIFQISGGDPSGTGSLVHSAASTSPGNNSSSLSKVYSADAFVYDIRNDANQIPGLYLSDPSGSTLIANNVENMVILYGVDTDNDGTANQYVRANAVTDMNDVISLRISILMRSASDNINPTPVAYTFNNQTITPTDTRLRRVYTATVVLRNRS